MTCFNWLSDMIWRDKCKVERGILIVKLMNSLDPVKALHVAFVTGTMLLNIISSLAYGSGMIVWIWEVAFHGFIYLRLQIC